MRLVYAGLASALLLSAPALADDFCSPLLTSRAFNVSESSSRSDMAASAHNYMCQTNWSNYQSFENRAQSGNIDIKYAEFVFGLSGQDNRGDTLIQQTYAKYCASADYTYKSDYDIRQRTVDASLVVDAYSKCVDAYLAGQTRGLFVSVADGKNHNYVDVTFIYKPGGGGVMPTITTTLLDNPDVHVTCLNGKASVLENYRFPANKWTVRCTKDKAVETSLTFNTDLEGPITIKSFGEPEPPAPESFLAKLGKNPPGIRINFILGGERDLPIVGLYWHNATYIVSRTAGGPATITGPFPTVCPGENEKSMKCGLWVGKPNAARWSEADKTITLDGSILRYDDGGQLFDGANRVGYISFDP